MVLARTVLREPRRSLLHRRLDALNGSTDLAGRLAADPVAFARRYADPRDAEIAGLVAALMAFGRVDLFRPVVARVLAAADRRGGPRAYVESFDPSRDGDDLAGLVYRWNRGIDFVLLFATLRTALGNSPVESLFAGWRPSHGDVGTVLGTAVGALRAAALDVAPACGVRARRFEDLPRGFRYFLPSPTDGSACKRWNMYLRWMVRPADGVDLGLWSSLPRTALVVPLDTHVGRIAVLVGLTRRTDGSWRTAVEVTRNLARLDPDDPVRFDFALAHLGISGRCRGERDDAICPECPLQPVCVHG